MTSLHLWSVKSIFVTKFYLFDKLTDCEINSVNCLFFAVLRKIGILELIEAKKNIY